MTVIEENKSRASARRAFAAVIGLSVCAGAVELAGCSRTGLSFGYLGLTGVSPDADTGTPGGEDGSSGLDGGTELDSSTLDDAQTPEEASTINYGLVLFGGAGGDGNSLSDTWVFTDGGWTEQDAGGPIGRYRHSMISFQGTILLYGGLRNVLAGNQFTETWEWDGTSWFQLSGDGPLSNTSPIPLAELNGTVVAYILNTGAGASTWVWNGAKWSLKSTMGPPRSEDAVMGTVGNQVIWVGSGETWAWDGSAWTQLAAAAPVVTPEAAVTYMATLASSLVFLAPAPSVVALNGTTFPGTAIWNGSSWNPLAATGPSARQDPAMTATPTEAFVFGGAVPGTMEQTALDDTWAWDGGAWTQLNAPGPSARFGAAMAAMPVPAGQ